MAVLPIGFFMPLPLPIMIPFMMWQSAAIAAGFGTYFQFAKRRVSAMSNEEFNKADPHELVNSMYEDIVKSIPSSFAKVDSLTPVILSSMNVMLDQAIKWLSNVITGNIFDTPSQPTDTPTDDVPSLPDIQLLTLTIQFIATMNDLSLQATLNRIADYDQVTQDLLIAEKNRRERNAEPFIIPPTNDLTDPNDFSSQILFDEFFNTLTQSDFQNGGTRTRIYKGNTMSWTVIRKMSWNQTTKKLSTFKWVLTWTIIGIPQSISADLFALVNNVKSQVGADTVVHYPKSGNHLFFLTKRNK